MIVQGNVKYDPAVDYSKVTTITGNLDCYGADTRTAFPALTSVGGYIDCSGARTRTAFPALTSVGGYIYCSGADTLTAFPALTSVGGPINCSGARTRTAFPALTSVGGHIYCSGADTRTAFPALTSVGGYIDCYGADTRTAFPALTSVGGPINCSGADTRTAFPALTSVGGYIYCSGADTRTAFPEYLIRNGPTARDYCTVLLRQSFAAVGMLYADGILARFVSTKSTANAIIHSVILAGKTTKSYVIERNGVFSHGDTIKQAKESFMYKLADRDTGKYSGWTTSTIVSVEEAIQSYRAITGACEAGTKHFCDGQKLKKQYSVAEVIALTKGAYGAEAYKSFFKV